MSILGPAPEVGEGRVVPVQQGVEPLARVRLREDPTTVSKHHREQVDAHALLAQVQMRRPQST